MIVRESVINDYLCAPDKVQCIYYAPFGQNRERSINNSKYASKNILFVGLEWERKGGPALANAFELVLRKVPDAKLTLVGCSPLVELPNVEIVGPVSNDRLQNYYERAAVFCLPTRREPFGIVFIEAMSYGLPVIGTDIGALPEFIVEGKNGFLIQVNDVDKLADLLVRLISDPDLCSSLGRCGYETYQQKFTLDCVSYLLKNYIAPFISNGIPANSNE
jgi:glycosyltransferase involved in cell wall biosynthesis